MQRADEGGRMIFPHNEFLLYICIRTGYLLRKICNFIQVNNKKHLLQFKVKYDGKTIKMQDR